jgi:hypothetical protein
MPTTFSNLVPVRRVAVGDCSGPLGSGFDALARSAYTALRAAEWTQSADPPFLPVHDNGQTANKTIPRGDAWKCSYGYDAAARTERSACGAVCYTFAIPSDATAGTPADITTVSLSLTGDRYLDAGVDLYLVPSASALPPTIAEILALTPAGTYCATSDQSPTKPNERHGVTEAVTATPGVAARPYLHVALFLHDYTTNRGAWIEGGAMLEGSAATIGFSRDVSAGVVYPSGYSVPLFRAATGADGEHDGLPCLSTFYDRYWLETNAGTNSLNDNTYLAPAYDLWKQRRLVQRESVMATSDNLDYFDSLDALAWIYEDPQTPACNRYEFYAAGFALFAPTRKITGLRYNVAITALSAGTVFAALVESDSLPAYGETKTTDASDDAIEAVVPWRDVLNIRASSFTDAGALRSGESYPNIIAATRRALTVNQGAGSTVNTVALFPVREPTKKWLWLVIVPGGAVRCHVRSYEYEWVINSVAIN